MARNHLKRLRKTELLELLITQSRRVDELEKEVARLRARLEDRTIAIDNAGDLASACLQINHIFETAQKTANYYLENVAKLCERRLKEAGLEIDEEAGDDTGEDSGIESGKENGTEAEEKADTEAMLREGDGGDARH